MEKEEKGKVLEIKFKSILRNKKRQNGKRRVEEKTTK